MSTGAATSSASGSIFLRKTGPLANWMWMALLLLVALVYSMWRRNQQAAVEVDTEQTDISEVPGDQTPPPVFILPQNPQPTVPINITLPGPAPARPGWQVPRPTTPAPAPPVATKPPPVKPTPKPGPPPKPAIAYDAVPIVKYVDPPGSKGPAWNSTLWGIAKQYGYGAAGNNWQSIWNDPRNADIRKKRGKPERVQPGDTIYVRRK